MSALLLLQICILFLANLVLSAPEPRQINLREPNNPDLNEAIAQGLIQRYSGDGPSSTNSSASAPPDQNHFRLLELDGDHLLIGAADSVHNVSIASFQSVNIFHWAPGPEARGECQMKSMDESLCRNFVRVLGRLGQGRLLVCGTNALRPACRILSPQWEMVAELPGTGLAPLDPAQNSSHLLSTPGDMLYSATVADLAGTDPLLFRRNVSDPSDRGLRTQRGNALQLDRPQFVGTLQNEEHVYLFFREDAVEADFQPATFSRVARVCKRDRGGPPGHYGQEWTSFVKARLNCSIAAGTNGRPFYFDQLIAVSSPPLPGGLVYATFVSEFDFLRHSVVCAFRLGQIDAIFRSGPYLGMEPGQQQRRWTPRPRDDLTAGLGQCRADSERMSEDEALARRKFPLMADSVPNALPRGAAAGIHRGSDHYSQIAVLPSVAHDAGHSDVLYVATDQGNVLKLVNVWPANEAPSSPIAPLNSTQQSPHSNAFPPPPPSVEDPLVPVALLQLANSPIRRLLIAPGHRALIVVTDSVVFRLPLHFCGFHQSCGDCVSSRDPHCVWHAGKCRAREDIEPISKEENGGIGKRQTTSSTTTTASASFLQDVLAKRGGSRQLCAGIDDEEKLKNSGNGDELGGGQKIAKIRPNWAGGCECAEKQNGGSGRAKCDCHSKGQKEQQQFLMMEEPKRRAGTTSTAMAEGGKMAWGEQLKALPWWVILLAMLAILQPLAFVWLLCRWFARRRASKTASRHAIGPVAAKFGTSHSAHHHCSSGSSGGLISAYSPASILSGPIGPKESGVDNIWTSRTTTTLSSSSPSTPNRTTPSSSPKGSAGEFVGNGGRHANEGNVGTGTGSRGRFTLQGWSLMPPRRASISGGEISVQLDGSAAPSAGLMTLPLHFPPPPAINPPSYQPQYHQIYSPITTNHRHPSTGMMSTFSAAGGGGDGGGFRR